MNEVSSDYINKILHDLDEKIVPLSLKQIQRIYRGAWNHTKRSLKLWIRFKWTENGFRPIKENYDELDSQNSPLQDLESRSKRRKHKRNPIPPEIRIEVWERDAGLCVLCGSTEYLEYDHLIPVSRGGSNSANNIRVLCRKCNRQKSDGIGDCRKSSKERTLLSRELFNSFHLLTLDRDFFSTLSSQIWRVMSRQSKHSIISWVKFRHHIFYHWCQGGKIYQLQPVFNSFDDDEFKINNPYDTPLLEPNEKEMEYYSSLVSGNSINLLSYYSELYNFNLPEVGETIGFLYPMRIPPIQ